MAVGAQLLQDLDRISQQVWEICLDDSTFDALRRKSSWLSAQIAVHYALQRTAEQLHEPQNNSFLPVFQGRLSKFIDTVYGTSDNNPPNETRWQKLRELECTTFLFIAISYTPLDLSKLSRIEFEYLLENAAKYLQVKDLPPRWLFRKEIQVAIAAKADLENISSFRKSWYRSIYSKEGQLMRAEYHSIEFNSHAPEESRPGKRLRLGMPTFSSCN